MLSILYEGHLKPSERLFGSARHLDWVGDMRRAVCFSEVPLPYLGRIANRYSQYGIAFKQTFLASNRGGRVWYIDVGSAHEEVWLELVREHEARHQPGHGFWPLATCVDRAGRHGERRYEFEWEREWRIPGPLGLQFTPDDVEFLFIPGELHGAARTFFDEAEINHSGPAYSCPYVDALWPPERIDAALSP